MKPRTTQCLYQVRWKQLNSAWNKWVYLKKNLEIYWVIVRASPKYFQEKKIKSDDDTQAERRCILFPNVYLHIILYSLPPISNTILLVPAPKISAERNVCCISDGSFQFAFFTTANQISNEGLDLAIYAA